MKIEGDLGIYTADDALIYKGVTSVGGNLYIDADAKLDALTSVGGNLYIYADAKLDALTSVGGYALPSAEETEKNLRRIAPLALAEGALEMRAWHCGTSHCLAGWGQKEILGIENDGTASLDGTRVLGIEAAKHFHVSDEKAREFLGQYI